MSGVRRLSNAAEIFGEDVFSIAVLEGEATPELRFADLRIKDYDSPLNRAARQFRYKPNDELFQGIWLPVNLLPSDISGLFYKVPRSMVPGIIKIFIIPGPRTAQENPSLAEVRYSWLQDVTT